MFCRTRALDKVILFFPFQGWNRSSLSSQVGNVDRKKNPFDGTPRYQPWDVHLDHFGQFILLSFLRASLTADEMTSSHSSFSRTLKCSLLTSRISGSSKVMETTPLWGGRQERVCCANLRRAYFSFLSLLVGKRVLSRDFNDVQESHEQVFPGLQEGEPELVLGQNQGSIAFQLRTQGSQF